MLLALRQRGRKQSDGSPDDGSPGSATDGVPGPAAIQWQDQEVNPLLWHSRGHSSHAGIQSSDGSVSPLERLADEGRSFEEGVSLWHQTSDYEKVLQSDAGETVPSGPANWYSRVDVLPNCVDHRISARSDVEAPPELPARVSRISSPPIEYFVNTDRSSPFSASKPRRQTFGEAKEEVLAITEYAQTLELRTDTAASREVRFAAPAIASSRLPPPAQLPAPQEKSAAAVAAAAVAAAAMSNQAPVKLPAPRPTWKVEGRGGAWKVERPATSSAAEPPDDDDKNLDALVLGMRCHYTF